ncbi:MAG: MarR family transcriptional regulator [Methanocalculus sp.]|uniref:MarR family transcriptional regulator n=1 Tax=Methanocalculus sp. TaxID=2004547 RepID=UPI0027165A84|nr:MarR family transcriptional regulator [Methanocalculus sp.]MDO8842658.1 MarR family transcriptional regulator [Methanocalculus sp.]MDO9538498.1 MarR family transcriptional regulator [Methanocalculus sp.]
MKDEEVDWDIYHRITLGQAKTIPDLVKVTGYSEESVLASVTRLVTYLMIARHGDQVRPLELEEMLLSCKIRYTKDLPVTIEGGIIRLK